MHHLRKLYWTKQLRLYQQSIVIVPLRFIQLYTNIRSTHNYSHQEQQNTRTSESGAILTNESSSSTTRNNGTSTFVSNHYRVDASQLRTYLTQIKHFDVRETSTAYIIKLCPFCHPINDRVDNMYKWYVYKDNGRHHCHRCGAQGSYFDMKKRLGDSAIEITNIANTDKSMNSKPISNDRYSADNIMKYHNELMNAQSDPQHKYNNVLNYLTQTRGLTIDTLKYYGIGAMTYNFTNENNVKEIHNCIVFPWSKFSCTPSDQADDAQNNIDVSTILPRIKLRSVLEKRHQRIIPAGTSIFGWFGGHTIPSDATSIVITEGEFDAMSCYQATKLPAVSLPNGAQSLPIELVATLERFEKIYLWMDNDLAGQDGCQKFIQKLGVNRCYIIKPDIQYTKIKDANDCLLQHIDMMSMIKSAQLQPHEQITTFRELRADILQELNEPDKSRGVPSLSLPTLNRIIKGHRRGELTVLTGPTGVGKTTVLSQLSLDYCQQNVVTLWGSFEIKISRLARTMLSQYAGINFNTNINALELFDTVADKFEQLPMYFLRYFGSTSVHQVIDAMEYAVYVYDVEHIILDNLQFMLSSQHRGIYDKFDLQDKAIDALRQFATNKNVHITLVCHPRKEHDNQSLGISSIFGSGKVAQEADNIIILNTNSASSTDNDSYRTSNSLIGDSMLYSATRRFEIRKNRYDGDLGFFEYRYHIDKCRVIELDADPNFNVFGINLNTNSITSNTLIDHTDDVVKNKNTMLINADAQVNTQSNLPNTEPIIIKTKRVRRPKQQDHDVLTE